VHQTPLLQVLADAPDRPLTTAAEAEEEYFLFRLAGLTFGVVSQRVREVVRMGPLTPLPRSPSYVLGVVGHRGEVLPLIDLLRFFGQGEAKPHSRSRLFVGDLGQYLCAFLSDGVAGLKRVVVSQRLPPPLATGAQTEFLVGLVQTKEFGTVNLLDLTKIMTSVRSKAVAR
jgi:purine-binding chemotaxis protein CheW